MGSVIEWIANAVDVVGLFAKMMVRISTPFLGIWCVYNSYLSWGTADLRYWIPLALASFAYTELSTMRIDTSEQLERIADGLRNCRSPEADPRR